MKDYLALKASAGSGKTFALSVRYIALVLRGENINEIIALTFTKKSGQRDEREDNLDLFKFTYKREKGRA